MVDPADLVMVTRLLVACGMVAVACFSALAVALALRPGRESA